MLISRKKVIIFSVPIFFVAVIFIISINSVGFLCLIAGSSDVPSKMHYWAIERVLILYDEGADVGEQILEALKSNESNEIIDVYIKIVGLIGEKEALGYLNKIFVEALNKNDPRGLTYPLVNTFGLMGNDEIVSFLQYILENYRKYNINATKYSIVRSLFLLTGRKYEYVKASGSYGYFEPTSEFVYARHIIISSYGRRRTFEEMVVLDKLFRPPGW
jgi:hypothetical protein